MPNNRYEFDMIRDNQSAAAHGVTLLAFAPDMVSALELIRKERRFFVQAWKGFKPKLIDVKLNAKAWKPGTILVRPNGEEDETLWYANHHVGLNLRLR